MLVVFVERAGGGVMIEELDRAPSIMTFLLQLSFGYFTFIDVKADCVLRVFVISIYDFYGKLYDNSGFEYQDWQ